MNNKHIFFHKDFIFIFELLLLLLQPKSHLNQYSLNLASVHNVYCKSDTKFLKTICTVHMYICTKIAYLAICF